MTARLSPAREAEIRAMDVNAQGWAVTREVLAELDAVRRERDEAVKVAATMRDALERIANDDPYPVHTALAALAAVPSSTDGEL